MLCLSEAHGPMVMKMHKISCILYSKSAVSFFIILFSCFHFVCL